jgi:hypothetical protein
MNWKGFDLFISWLKNNMNSLLNGEVENSEFDIPV